MKNFLFPLGVLAAAATLSTGVAAQSSVTLYGIADLGVIHVSNTDGKSQTALANGRLQSSRLGFRGREDLGGGLSAIFNMEHGMDLNTGAAASPTLFYNRQTWMGLSSKTLGTITLGRQYSPIYDLMIQNGGAPTFGVTGGAVEGIASGKSAVARFDNTISGNRAASSIKYASPVFGGFRVVALASLDASTGDTSAGRTLSIAAGYKNGPLDAALGYWTKSCPAVGGCTATQAKDKVFAATAGYNLGIARVTGLYSQQRDAKNVKGNDADTLSLAATFPVNAWKLSVGYQFQNDKTALNHDVQQVNLAAQYDLSKRTAFYAFAATQRVDNGGLAGMGLTTSSNSRQNQFAVGLRHAF